MDYAKIIYKFIQGALGVVVFSVVALLLLGHFGYINTVKPFVVQSGSMEPAVQTASIVFSLPQDSYQQGEIITFHPEGNLKKTVTHRIEFKLHPDGVNEAPLFVTAGDANEEVDNWQVRNEHIIGKAVISVPYVGYLVDFAKKPEGFILLVIIPATIVIYEELKNLFKEIKKGLQRLSKKKKKEFTLSEKNESKGTMSNLPKSWSIIPIFGAGIFMIAFSASYFTDIEVSLENIFQAGTWGPPPPQIAETLVINEVLPVSACHIGGSDKTGVWLEVYNGYSDPVNLKDFKITDGTNTPIALIRAGNLILNHGDFALLAHDKATWKQCVDNENPDVKTGQLGTGNFDINSKHLRLLDSEENIIDTVKWGLPEFPTLEIVADKSIEREPDGQDTALNENFNPDDFEVKVPPNPGY